jgi:uncharacterized membrane protein YfcA
MEFYLLLFLAGLAGGMISGLLGVGGGLIYILILPIAFSYIGIPNQEIAQYGLVDLEICCKYHLLCARGI